MEEILSIIKILSQNIARTPDMNIDKALENQVSKYYRKYPILLESSNLMHIKNHVPYNLRLKNCQQEHCLQCFHDNDLYFCNHGCRITFYEKSLIASLYRDIENVDDRRYIIRRCSQCRRDYNITDMEKKKCTCYECLDCLLDRYKRFDITCCICLRAFEEGEIQSLLDVNGVEDIEFIEVCRRCGLAIYSKGFSGDFCFICQGIADRDA